MKKTRLGWNHVSGAILLTIILGGCGPTSPAPRAGDGVWTSYHGWQALRLGNDRISAVIVPEIGRMMDLRLVGGDNVMQANPNTLGRLPAADDGFINYGGLYTWPAPQEHWINADQGIVETWPPNLTLDRGPYAVIEARDDYVRLLSPTAAGYEIALEKEYWVEADAVLHYRVTIHNRGDQAIRWAVMNLMAIPLAGTARFRGDPADVYFNEDWTDRRIQRQRGELIMRPEGDEVVFELGAYRAQVAGTPLAGNFKAFVTPGAEELIYDNNGVRLRRMFEADVSKLYTDRHRQIEIYAHAAGGDWCELEVLSPDMVILPGGQMSWAEQFELSDLSSQPPQ